MNNDVRTGMHMPTLPTRRGTLQPGGILGEFREPTSFGRARSSARRVASRRATRETALKLGRPRRLCPEESQPARRTHVYSLPLPNSGWTALEEQREGGTL